ncbi:MAG: DUF5011 domain-containing protein, partial [Ghiorsea sp.]|nr:DUF5011 domain-containing protein [Ghiorsea sp.]
IKMVDIEAGAGIEYDTCGLLHDMNPYHYKDNNESYGEVNATYDEHPNTNGYTKMGQKWFTDMNASGWLSDVTNPVIILNGQNPQNIELNTPYVDMNATVTDNKDVNRTIEGSGTVDTAVEGTYTITYSATDVAGNVAEDVNRTVVVSLAADTTPPVITLTGDNPVNLEYGTSYTDEGATASDDRDGDINVTTGGLHIDTKIAGTYTVTYNATDAAGNKAEEVTRTVVVEPNPADDKNTTGKLRLLYEAIPMGFVMEQAGGKSMSKDMLVSEVQPEALHQRVPVYLGSKTYVDGLLKG